MKLSKKRKQHIRGMDITPMIDITFLLLIFFITVTQVSETNREPVELPKLKGEEDRQKTSIVVNVNENGQIVVAGSKLDIADLALLVSNEIESAAGDPSMITIVVRIDHRAPCLTPNKIVKQLANMGILKVRLAVQVPS